MTAECVGLMLQSEKSSGFITCRLVCKGRLVSSRALQINLYDRLVFQIERNVAVEQRVVVAAPDVEQHL